MAFPFGNGDLPQQVEAEGCEERSNHEERSNQASGQQDLFDSVALDLLWRKATLAVLILDRE